MEHTIILLNFGPVKIEDKQFYKLEYCFADVNMFVNTDKRKGAIPHQAFCTADLTGKLKLEDIFTTFKLVGELINDFKNPLNQKFKPQKLINTQTKNVIDLSK